MAAYKRLASQGDSFVTGGANSPVTLRGLVVDTGNTAASVVMSDGGDKFTTVALGGALTYVDYFATEVRHGLSASLTGGNAEVTIVFD